MCKTVWLDMKNQWSESMEKDPGEIGHTLSEKDKTFAKRQTLYKIHCLYDIFGKNWVLPKAQDIFTLIKISYKADNKAFVLN